MSKTNVFTSRHDGTLAVSWVDREQRPTSVPPVIDAEFCAFEHLKTVVRYMLQHYFFDEADGEIKARLLASGVARKLRRLGRAAARPTHDGGRSFYVTEAELNDIVIEVLLDAKRAPSDAVVLEWSGQRRDIIRSHMTSS